MEKHNQEETSLVGNLITRNRYITTTIEGKLIEELPEEDKEKVLGSNS